MFWDSFPSNDGKRLFLPAFEEQRELVRYDGRLKQFVPFLSGIPAKMVTFSRDRQCVAYQNSVDGTLWRSRADGTDRLQLTFPPLTVWSLGWSPDGSQIAFSASTYGTAGKIYLIPRDGGNPQTVMPGEDLELSPSWSPDGSSLLFARVRDNPGQIPTSGGTEPIPHICLLDLRTRQITTLPGSEGLTQPVWSPDARFVVARTNDNRKVLLFDFEARHWTEIATVHVVHGIYFSSDSRYVYFQDLEEGENQPIYRINVRSRKLQRVASRKQLLRADVTGYGLSGLTPDDSPLATLVRNNCDIYALDVDFP